MKLSGVLLEDQVETNKLTLKNADNKECAFSYEDLTKLKLLLDIKLSMDKHGVINIEKEFSFEHNGKYRFKTSDGVLEVIPKDHSKTLSLKHIPLDLLKEFAKEINEKYYEDQSTRPRAYELGVENFKCDENALALKIMLEKLNISTSSFTESAGITRG